MRARLSRSRLGIGSIILLIGAAGIASLALFLQHERARDTAQWRDKLNLIADTQARGVSGWVQNQFRELSSLADNASLQIYFTQLQAQADGEPLAQAEYLRSLMTMTSQRLGFEPSTPTLQQQIGANVRKLGSGGLALIDNSGKLVMATDYMPPLAGGLTEKLTLAPRGESSLLDITQEDSGAQRLGFVIPIYGVQQDRSPAAQTGRLVGVRLLDGGFFALLAPQPTPEQTLEVMLVRAEGKNVRYLTPLLDQSPLMSHAEPLSESSAAVHALAHTGEFAEKIDYRGQPVFFTARAVAGTPWVLIAKIDRAEALAQTTVWRNTVAIAILLLLAALTATVVAIWRNAVARAQSALAEEWGARAELLSAVTDNQPEPLYIVDEYLGLWFANHRAAELMLLGDKEPRGKSIANAMGKAFAQAVNEPCQLALEYDRNETRLIERSDERGLRTIHARFVPLSRIPVEGVRMPTRGVLIAEQDVTEMIEERELRVDTLKKLVSMLVSLVDKRDPHAARHSAQVAEVAAATARIMGLDSVTVETTATAAQLMNLGKADIPAGLLTRDGVLNDAERATIRSSLAATADLLRNIAFHGPVAETLCQAQERMDGSGPLNMNGQDVLISARIIAVANALVGMVSPRSYRPAMAWDEVIEILHADTGKHFDRRVVSALMHYLDNQGGREWLKEGAAAERLAVG